ncbi:MAG: DUF4153 domain-containing protein [Myxococcota bacterium]
MSTPLAPPPSFAPPASAARRAATAGPYRPAPAEGAAKRDRAPRRPLRRRELAALGGAVLMVEAAWLGPDGLATGGVGLAFVFAALPALLVVSARPRRVSPRLLALLAAAGLVSLRCLLAPNWVAVLAGLLLPFAVALALRAPHTTGGPWLRSLGQSVVAVPSRMGRLLASRHRVAGRFPRLRGGPAVMLPALLSLVFVGVFALANPFVGEALGQLGSLFGHIELPAAGRVAGWALALVVALVLVRPSVVRAGRRAQAPVALASASQREVARNTLVALNVVFAAYLALEALTVTRGAPPAGVTTQAFAHRVAFWLTVALALLTLVVGVLFRGPLGRDPQARRTRRLALVWAGQGLVLAGLTYGRIGLHVRASGLSDLRIVGFAGTTLVVIGVLLVIAKVHGERPVGWLLDRQADAFAVMLVLYAVVPTHRIAAQANVARLLDGDAAPLLHVWAQAKETESALTLLPLLDHDDPVVREGVAGLLLTHRDALRRQERVERSWRERSLLAVPVREGLETASRTLEGALGTTSRVEARQALGQRTLGWPAASSP